MTTQVESLMNFSRGFNMTTLRGNQIHKARLLALRAGMNLEALGIRVSKGRSFLATVKREFNWKGNRATIIELLTEVIDSIPDTP